MSKDMWRVLSHKNDINGKKSHTTAVVYKKGRSKQHIMTFPEIPKMILVCLKEIPFNKLKLTDTKWRERLGMEERSKIGRKSFPDHISNSITLIDLPDKDTSILLLFCRAD